MNSLRTYTKQRFNIGLWLVVALMLIALSIRDLTISSVQVYSLPFVIYFLFTMRLFDDLASAEIDREKENREYTNEAIKKELKIILIIAQLALISILAFVYTTRAVILFYFLVVNAILYFSLFNISKFRYFLPLLKYPFVIYAINLELSINLLTTFGAIVIFEMLEDPLFPNYLLTNYEAKKPNKKYIPYLFLLFLLLTQLILNNV